MANARQMPKSGARTRKSASTGMGGRKAGTGVAGKAHDKPVRKESALKSKMKPRNEMGGQGRR
jgi:hypothetical protein